MPAFFEYDIKGNALGKESKAPGQGIGDIKTLQGVELRNLEYGQIPTDPDATYAQNGDEHGNDGSTHAPQGAGGYIHKTAQKIGGTNKTEPQQAVVDGFL